MKTKFLLLAFVVLFTREVFAQDRQHEVHIGYGVLSTNEFVDAFSDILAAALTGGSYKTENAKSTGNIRAR